MENKPWKNTVPAKVDGSHSNACCAVAPGARAGLIPSNNASKFDDVSENVLELLIR